MENHKRTHKKLIVIRPQNFVPSQFSIVPEQQKTFLTLNSLPSKPINLKKRKNESILSASSSKRTKIQIVHPVVQQQNSSNDLLKQAMEISDLNAIMNGVAPIQEDEIQKPESKNNLLKKAMEISDLNDSIMNNDEGEQTNFLAPQESMTQQDFHPSVQVNYDKAVSDFNIDFLLQ